MCFIVLSGRSKDMSNIFFVWTTYWKGLPPMTDWSRWFTLSLPASGLLWVGGSWSNHCERNAGGGHNLWKLKNSLLSVYNQHKFFHCVLLIRLKLHTYVYSDILGGTYHIFHMIKKWGCKSTRLLPQGQLWVCTCSACSIAQAPIPCNEWREGCSFCQTE